MNDLKKQIKTWKQGVKEELSNFAFFIATLTLVVQTCNNPAWMKGSAAFSAAYIELQVVLLVNKIDDIEEG